MSKKKYQKEALKVANFLEKNCGWTVNEETMMKCSDCGYNTRTPDLYCSRCGTLLKNAKNQNDGVEDIRQALLVAFN